MRSDLLSDILAAAHLPLPDFAPKTPYSGLLQIPIQNQNLKSFNFRGSLIVGQESMGGGNEGCGELEGIWGFEAVMGSKESSPFGDFVGNGKDRKMGEVAKNGEGGDVHAESA